MLPVTYKTGNLDNFFDSFFTKPNWYSTSVKSDVVQYEDRYELILDVPGVSKKDISIKTEKDTLTVSFDNKTNYDSAKVFTSNRNRGKAEQSYIIPNDVDVGNITAQCKDGVLTIKLPMTAKAQPKEIVIV